MANPMDDDQLGLGSDLQGYATPQAIPPGLHTALMGAPVLAPGATDSQAPVAAASPKVPGYIDSQTGRFVPLVPGTSPGAFAAQQQSPWENLMSGYGAETLTLGRSASDLGRQAMAAISGNTPLPATKNPNQDLDAALKQSSLAARAGSMLADQVNTLPISMAGGAAAAPIAASIKGAGFLPVMARAAVNAAVPAAAVGAVMPADDGDDRAKNALKAGATDALKGGAKAGLKKALMDAFEDYL